MNYCSNCGIKIEDGIKFCSGCGSQVGVTATSINQGSPQMTTAFQNQSSVAPVDDKSLWEYFTGCFKKYATFQGRARRKEYWGFFLFYIVFAIIIAIIDGFLNEAIFGLSFESYGPIIIIWYLATILPYLSVSVRRYHDCNKIGWVIFIPVYNFILDFTDGTHGANRFGNDPKGR
jgi:uncharacterized membrane protein YhaH (DUF805 family)